MKRVAIFLMAAMLIIGVAGCGSEKEKYEPDESQMRAICELAVMECYYHNVAKYFEEDAASFLFWSKDKEFWIEYGGCVTLGIDASRVSIDCEGTTIHIALPPVEVWEPKVDDDTLTPESFIIADGSAKIEAEDEVHAIGKAQEALKMAAEADSALLDSAKQRVKQLLSDYIDNISRLAKINYVIEWSELDADPDAQQQQTANPQQTV